MFNIQDSVLGKKTPLSDSYDPKLLFRVPRAENRERYNIEEKKLPFVGVDVWNCYEVSFLTNNGLPVSRIMKLIYPANSKYLVESKSLKLYLNSLNFEHLGETIDECVEKAKDLIKSDLETLLETDVEIELFNWTTKPKTPFSSTDYVDLVTSAPIKELSKLVFGHFTESPDLLLGKKNGSIHHYALRTDILRSNCRVTDQPDWGDLFLRMETEYQLDLCALVAYLVSFRKENHFHEEVTEMIYKRLSDAFSPRKLMVASMYTRRGGIDINPIRASHTDWLDEVFMNKSIPLAKTWRQ